MGRTAGALLFMLGCVVPGFGENVPSMQTTALDGTPVVFPKTANAKPLVLLLGFSHSSSGDLAEWNRKCTQRLWMDTRLDYYELVDLQGVPSFVKPMILHGMRKAIEQGERPHFAPFYKNEGEWKALVHYSEPKHIYAIVADESGRAVWSEEGPATDEKCATLANKIAGVLHQN